MSVWFRRRLRRHIFLRKTGASLALSISQFTIFLLLFAQSAHFLWTFSIAGMDSFCHYAAFWLNGWFEFAAPHQWLGIAIIIIIALFGLRTVLLSTHLTSPWETLFQGVLIGGLSLAFLAHTAFLFPYVFPGATKMSELASAFFPEQLRLVEVEDYVYEWPYDFPEAPGNPQLDRNHDSHGWEIFKSSEAPTWGEYAAMQACRVQYDKDLEAYRRWEREFEKWYRENRHRY